MKKYKVWVEIEEVDEDTDINKIVDWPEEVGEYNTLDEATQKRDKILENA